MPIWEDAVFQLNTDFLAPHKKAFEKAKIRLPAAHHEAQKAAITHVHNQVRSRLSQAGVDSSPVSVMWNKGTPSIGIAHGEAGDKLADIEFGTPGQAPEGHIRAAITRAKPEAQKIYENTLYRGMGL
jgi:hypothetical protein